MRFLTKDELPLVQLLIQNDIADNVYRASAIVVGLELASLPTDEERLARARLYRDHRNSGENATVSFAVLAIAIAEATK